MLLADTVKQLISDNSDDSDEKNNALKNAERLADMFADIKPQPNNIPMEKYFGLPAFNSKKKSKCLE